MDHVLLRSLHQSLALVSLSGFIVRWYGRVHEMTWAQAKITRILPHIIDTVFFFTGLLLAWQSGLFNHLPAWLWAKLIGLLLYILLGGLAMRTVHRYRISCWFFSAAIACFAWIVSTAIGKSPLAFVQIFPFV